MVTRNYRTLLFLILIVCSWHSSFAGGPMGGEIRYTYLYGSGDYEVTLVLYQTPSTNASNQPVNVFLNSTCYGSDTLTMTSFIPFGMIGTTSGGVRFSPREYCSDTLAMDSLKLLAFYYRDTVTLPGTCADFTFTYKQCCRDSIIDNVVQPENSIIYLKAKLNNVTGPNTSTSFVGGYYGLPRFLFYTDVTSYSSFGFSEPDGDSVLVNLVFALDSNGNPVAYAPGFGFNNPIPSMSSVLDVITPTQNGEFTIVFEILEYRYSQPGFWQQIGSSMYDVTIVVRDSFPDNVVSTAFGGPNIMDTISNVSYEDSIISFTISEFQLYSLTQEGSEFRVIGSDGLVRPIIKAGCYNPGTNLLGDSVWLKVYGGIRKNDSIQIQMQRGSDGNTLINPCGNEFTNFDNGILIISKGQFTALEESVNPKLISVYPNPTKDKITIEFEEDETPELCTLFDMQGRELKSVVPQSFKTELDISSFSKGVYLLEIKSAGLSQTRLVQKL